jgi:hypothetical protein
LTHPAQKPGNLTNAFVRGADVLSSALIRPLAPGLDVSALTSDRQDSAGKDTQTGEQKHDWLVAELQFRLPAVEVRSPAILPGGSRSSGLASIAEATGVNGAGLAGAIIRFFAMVWPNAPRIQVRAWVERTPGHEGVDEVTRVTVGLADMRTGASVGTKTLAAGGLDDAAAAVAGYVARHIFARDRTVPPTAAISGDRLVSAKFPGFRRRKPTRGPVTERLRTRRPWRYSTPS